MRRDLTKEAVLLSRFPSGAPFLCCKHLQPRLISSATRQRWILTPVPPQAISARGNIFEQVLSWLSGLILVSLWTQFEQKKKKRNYIRNSMKLVIWLHSISWVNSFSDISSRCILPNMIRAVNRSNHIWLNAFLADIRKWVFSWSKM